MVNCINDEDVKLVLYAIFLGSYVADTYSDRHMLYARYLCSRDTRQ